VSAALAAAGLRVGLPQAFAQSATPVPGGPFAGEAQLTLTATDTTVTASRTTVPARAKRWPTSKRRRPRRRRISSPRSSTPPPFLHADRISRPSLVRARPTIGHRRHTITRLGLAALLVLVGLGSLALWPASHDGRSLPAAFIQAPATPALPPGVLADETLLTLHLPAELLPDGSNPNAIGAGLARATIPVGARSSWSEDCCAGPLVEYVLSGRYTVRAQASLHVVRAGGVAEEIAAGTEVILGPGDALLSRAETPVEAANAGTEPVELLSWVLTDNAGMAYGHLMPGWTVGRADTRPYRIALAPAPATVRLRRVELAPGATLPASARLTFAVPVEARATIRKQPDGGIRNDETTSAGFYVLTLEQDAEASPVAGTPAP